MALDDIYYTLFRHKIKIIVCTLIGLIGAGAFFFLVKPDYSSNAKLFVRYVVMDGRAVRTRTDDTVTKSPDMRGETIIQSEQEILTSFDLAKKVAEVVGPEKIVGKDSKLSDVNTAAVIIRKGLTVFSQRFSSVISIGFHHSDPEVAQAVLRQTIEQYLKTHVEIHRSAGMVGDFLSQETDQLRSRLNQTEEELRKARAKAGVISIEESKRAYAVQIATIREKIFTARAEQSQQSAMLKEASAKMAAMRKPAAGDDATPKAPDATPEVTEIPPQSLDEYRNILARLDALRRQEQELLLVFTAEMPRVKESQELRATTEKRKQELEEKYPSLARGLVPRVTPANASPGAPAAGEGGPTPLDFGIAQVNSIEAKIKTLTEQMETLKKEAANLDQVEGTISDLQRRRELEEGNYRRYAASLEQSRISDALGDGKVSNISVIQTPSPPFMEPSKTVKVVAGIAFGGLAIGLGWAFLIELLLDTSVRRPKDIERNMRIPLFLTVPRQRPPSKRWRLRLPRRKKRKAEAAAAQSEAVVVVSNETEANPLVGQLNPYYETLRDRLIGYFESRSLTHKPKLVAVTSVGRDSGVTSTAAGLARCLSETGDGNVLLVDLTPGHGSAQYFHRGKAGCGLEELLDTPESANVQVQDRLYVVSDGSRGDKLSRLLPQRFAKLLPKLKSSDFDYVIFDMPPVSQISITPRLAGFMDMVLLVVEAEKNSREGIQRASALLAESNAHVGAVLNKTRSYIPAWLHQPLPV